MAEVRVALFDLDGTLLDVNSGHLWLREEWRSGRITTGVAVRALYWFGRYALGDDDLEHALEVAASLYAGEREAAVDAAVHAWFTRDLAHRLRPGARAALQAHREAGHTLVLATSSSQFAARCAVEAFGLDHGLSTVVAAQDGVLTGRVGVLGFGRHKLDLCRHWVSSRGLGLDACAFYTDSYSDISLLSEVTAPVAVNPDRRLARAARARGWPVVDWGLSTS